MKDEYKKNFVDINFYGMQTKVQNPMSNPEWRESFTKNNAEKEMNIKKLNDAKKMLKELKLESLLPAPQTEVNLSPEQKEKKRLDIITKFKSNVSRY